MRRQLWLGCACLCLQALGIAAQAATPRLAWKKGGWAKHARYARAQCKRLLAQSDFSENRFNNEWMSSENLTNYEDCLYALRTSLRPVEKDVHAGGVHYPTLVITNHRHPVVSTSGPRWCWLNSKGTGSNGLSPSYCCDTARGPRGAEECWDSHFSFELCCAGELDRGEFPHFYSVPALDLNVGNAIKRRGTFDQRMSYALQSLARPGDVVIDVGANLGGFTVPLAERVGPDGEVHAFEAFRKLYQHLNANVALNGLSNVYTYNVAVGREDKELELHGPDLSIPGVPSAMKVKAQQEPDVAYDYDNVAYERKRRKVSMRTLDSFDFGEKVDLMKIDVEFMELEVVLGARETIRRYRPVIWAENEHYFRKDPDRTFVDTMAAEFGYTCQPVADLELLCATVEATNEVVNRLSPLFKHLNMPVRHMSLAKVLAEVDPHFARTPH